MSTPTWVTLANANTVSQLSLGTAVSNFSSVTDVSPGTNVAGQAYQTNPAQLYPGQQWRFTANGIWSSTGSPGVSIGVYYGGAAGSPLCYGSVGAASTPANAASVPWYLQALGKLSAVGTNIGAWNVIGLLTGLQTSASLATSAVIPTMMPRYTAAAQYDTSIAKQITLASTCTASAAANQVTVYNWTIEYLTDP